MAQTWAVLISLVILSSTWRQCFGDEQPAKLPDESYLLTIPPTYSPAVRPNVGGEPVEVAITAYISHIDFKDGKIEAVFYFRSSWTDARLKSAKPATPMTFQAKHVDDKIWTPDLFFPNTVEQFQIINRGFIRITPETGAVSRSQMIKGTFSCHNLSRSAVLTASYHNATIQCQIEIESYGYSDKDITLKFLKGNESVTIDNEAGDQDRLFKILNVSAAKKVIRLSSGNYSRLSMVIGVKSLLEGVSPMTLLKLLEGRGRD